MNFWILADSHIGHRRLVEKGWRPEGFSGKILTNVARIPREDTLIHLGDVCLGNNRDYNYEFTHVAPSVKMWLCRGNHDTSNSQAWYLKRGWDFCAEMFWLDMFGHKILFSHIPQPESMGFTINIHGHLHGNGHRLEDPEVQSVLCDKHYLVALEDTNYQVLSLKFIINDFEKRQRA